MIQEHFDLLQGLIDRGIADRIEIHYNTNGTQWPEQAEELWNIPHVCFQMAHVNENTRKLTCDRPL
jgi:hypothetical protein